MFISLFLISFILFFIFSCSLIFCLVLLPFFYLPLSVLFLPSSLVLFVFVCHSLSLICFFLCLFFFLSSTFSLIFSVFVSPRSFLLSLLCLVYFITLVFIPPLFLCISSPSLSFCVSFFNFCLFLVLSFVFITSYFLSRFLCPFFLSSLL